MAARVGTEALRNAAYVDTQIDLLKSINLVHINGKTVVDNSDGESQEKWEKLSEQRIDRLYAFKWIEIKLKEAIEKTQKELEKSNGNNGNGANDPFQSIIDDLSYLMVLAFGLQVSRFCIFHVEGDHYVRKSVCPHWHPEDKKFPISTASNIIKRLLYNDEDYIVIEDPLKHEDTKRLEKLIRDVDIKSMEYHKVLDNWILIADTTGEKERLTDGDRHLFDHVCELLEDIILEAKKREELKAQHLKSGKIKAIGYMGGLLSHYIQNAVTKARGLACLLKKKIAAIRKGAKLDLDKLEEYVNAIMEATGDMEKFVKALSVSTNNLVSLSRLQKEDKQSIRLSDAINDGIRYLHENQDLKDKSIVFKCNAMGSNSVIADKDIVATAVYRIVKLIFSNIDTKTIDLVLEICDKTAMIVFFHEKFNPRIINEIYNRVNEMNPYEIEHNVEDYKLFASLEMLKIQGVEFEFEENEFSLIFKRL